MRTALLAAGLLAAATAAYGEETMVRQWFRDTASGLEYCGDGWTLRSAGERGWVSLRAGASEFLHATPTAGAFAFIKGEHWQTAFPDRGNLSHDVQVGRVGMVADGINMIRISPVWTRPEFELYLGANEPQDQRVAMLLSDDVLCIRIGGGDTQRAWAQTVLTRGAEGLRKARELFVVHRDGCALVIRSESSPGKDDKGQALRPPEIEAGVIKLPGGDTRLAVVFPCKGFVANAFRTQVDAVPRMENFALRPRFDVKSSDDPADGKFHLGPTNGVVNPDYTPDTRLDFGVVFGWLSPAPFSGYAELEVTHSLGHPHFRQRVELKDVTPEAAGGEIRAVFQPTFHLPGVSEVWARLVGADGRLIWTDRYRMAYDWRHYRPTLMAEPDFDAFWDQTLSELRAVPLEPETTRVPAFEDHPDFEIYDVTFNAWNRQRLHAMLYMPKAAAKPLPAIVTAHPGTTGFGVNKRADGTYGSELRQDKRFVTIVPLIRGHAPDAPGILFNHPWWGPLDDRDTYVARAWYCAMTRAIDYLATRPEWVDITRIVASGGSQGGALALATAALDPRVTVCLSDCPACCQPHEIMENYPSFGPSKGVAPPGRSVADVKRLLSYYNPVNLCPRIRCPTYVGSNIGDLTVHSMGPLAAYHNLTGLDPSQKDFYPGYTAMHGSGPGLGVKTREWLDKLGN
ncbi:MAG: Acetyl esterase Axe7A precursor [Lentisphaerae bacterium ADurb.BinA184]|nr:MAG: Acetyl esterase Axe7A precursor [Lentisphaerae bacterium ADurb.BinA184]